MRKGTRITNLIELPAATRPAANAPPAARLTSARKVFAVILSAAKDPDDLRPTHTAPSLSAATFRAPSHEAHAITGSTFSPVFAVILSAAKDPDGLHPTQTAPSFPTLTLRIRSRDPYSTASARRPPPAKARS